MIQAITLSLIASAWALYVAYRTDLRLFNLKQSLDKQYYLQRDIDRQLKVRLMDIENKLEGGDKN